MIFISFLYNFLQFKNFPLHIWITHSRFSSASLLLFSGSNTTAFLLWLLKSSPCSQWGLHCPPPCSDCTAGHCPWAWKLKAHLCPLDSEVCLGEHILATIYIQWEREGERARVREHKMPIWFSFTLESFYRDSHQSKILFWEHAPLELPFQQAHHHALCILCVNQVYHFQPMAVE